MCVCILKTKNGNITEERLKQAYNANPDGWGILYDGNYDFIPYDKAFWNSFIEFEDYYYEANRYYENNLIIHFRTASSSGFGKEFCHPFFVNENLAFVHNGNLFHFSSAFKNTNKRDNKTDTIRFNEQILQKLPENFLDDSKIFSALNSYCIDQNSKMIFMNNKGKVWILNEESGEWKDECWYSNRGMNNYEGYGYSGAYKYYKGNIRHKGGLPTVQLFSEYRRMKWFYCNCCNGWYSIFNERNLTRYGLICNSCKKYYELKEFCI